MTSFHKEGLYFFGSSCVFLGNILIPEGGGNRADLDLCQNIFSTVTALTDLPCVLHFAALSIPGTGTPVRWG